MSIRTYAVNCNDAWLNTEGDDISGSYVKYKDHQEVVAALEAKCSSLAAENAALKSFGDKLAEMHNDLNGEGTGTQGRAEVACQQVALEAAMEEFDAIKTPATDAFLAEVRAQESKRVYESILDNPAVTDMGSLVDWLEQNANDSISFAAQLRQEADQ